MRICIIVLIACVLQGYEPLLLSDFDKRENTKEQTFLVSEKLDGVRGLWDGEQMRYRSGRVMDLPESFLQNFPPFALDGELYNEEKSFSQIISMLKKQGEIHLKYYVFDVPEASGGLLERLEMLKNYLQKNPNNNIIIIKQTPLSDVQAIMQLLHKVTSNGGEGLVLRDKDAPYTAGRSKRDFKLKLVYDAECEVIGITKGKGKYKDKMGAIICKAWDKTFKIGSGLNDTIRENPPPVGSVISFKYYGLTNHHKPRFPIFWRIKEQE